MKRFYLINKKPGDKSGTVISSHKTFEAAEKTLERIRKQVDGTLPATIIESEKLFRKGQVVGTGEY